MSDLHGGLGYRTERNLSICKARIFILVIVDFKQRPFLLLTNSVKVHPKLNVLRWHFEEWLCCKCFYCTIKTKWDIWILDPPRMTKKPHKCIHYLFGLKKRQKYLVKCIKCLDFGWMEKCRPTSITTNKCLHPLLLWPENERRWTKREVLKVKSL